MPPLFVSQRGQFRAVLGDQILVGGYNVLAGFEGFGDQCPGKVAPSDGFNDHVHIIPEQVVQVSTEEFRLCSVPRLRMRSIGVALQNPDQPWLRGKGRGGFFLVLLQHLGNPTANRSQSGDGNSRCCPFAHVSSARLSVFVSEKRTTAVLQGDSDP